MILLPVHILGGLLSLVFGYVALYAVKGGAIHRKTGMYFVYAMTMMALTGAFIGAFVKFNRGNIIAGLLTFYFVSTGLLAVKRYSWARRFETVAMLFAFVVGILAIGAAMWLAQRGRFEAPPMFLFGVVAIGAALGDLKVVRSAELQKKARLKRHLWRVCFAMWVAAASFFWGPKGRVPEIIYYPTLLPIPVLAPIAVMFYWLWRLRGTRPVRGIVSASVNQPAEATS